MSPLWEGFDEWAHFAYVEHIATTGTLPTRTTAVSAEICTSLKLSPLSAFGGAAVSKSETYDSFWQIAEPERRRREVLLGARPASPNEAGCASKNILQYEAQQPPLYYVMLAPFYRLAQRESLPVRVLILRLVSLLIASSIVFTISRIGFRVLPSKRLVYVALLAVVAAPGLWIDICRVSNESLSIALTSALLLISLETLRRPARLVRWMLLGLLTGLAALTKAYALAFLPVLPLTAILAFGRWPQARRSILVGLALSTLLAIATAGWWYHMVWTTTHTLSGEQMDMARGQLGFQARLGATLRVDWGKVLDQALFTHIWTGGWSFLVARSWMYRLLEYFIALAAAGFVFHLYCRTRMAILTRRLPITLAGPLLVLYFLLAMSAVQAYHSLAVFLATGDSTALGWYFYAVVGAEVMAAALGLHAILGPCWSLRAMALLATMLVALDLYTLYCLLIPYYTGFIRHAHNGALPAFHFQRYFDSGNLREILLRLSYGRGIPGWSVACLWGLHAVSTLVLPIAAIRLFARCAPSPRRIG